MMPTDPRLPTPEARPATYQPVPGPCIGAEAALIEQAKGALMMYYGVDSHRAFEVLLGWARTTRSPVLTIAHSLLHGICEGDRQTEARQRPLVRWLEARLRDGGPGHGQLRTSPTGCSPAHETPRSG